MRGKFLLVLGDNLNSKVRGKNNLHYFENAPR